MTLKFRAWISEADTMANDLKGIDFENETVVLRKLYYEDGFPVETEVFEVEIGNAILMQSTDHRDRNSTEIFEGDVLEIQGIRMVVKFGNYRYIEISKRKDHALGIVYDGLGFYVECINVADPDRISPFEPETLKESAVIGNIYENKDILEDKK